MDSFTTNIHISVIVPIHLFWVTERIVINNDNLNFVEGKLTVELFSALVDVDNLTQDTFSRYQNHFDSADSLVKPTGPGNINWIGLPSRGAHWGLRGSVKEGK